MAQVVASVQRPAVLPAPVGGGRAIALVAALSPLLLFPGPWSVVALVALVVLLLRRSAVGERPAVLRCLDAALAVTLLMALVATVVSYDLALSLPELCGIVLGAVLCRTIAGAEPSDRLVARVAAGLVVAAAALAIAALFLTTWFSGRVPALDAVTRALPSIARALPGFERGSPGFHPNVVAGTLALLLPLPVGMLLRRRTPGGTLARVGLVLAITPMLATLALTQSRTGWLAALAGLALVAAVRYLGLAGRSGAAKVVRRLALVSAPIAGLGMLLAWPSFARLMDRLDLATFATKDGLGRVELWERSAAMLLDAPLTGVGLGNFPLVLDALYPDLSKFAPTLGQANVPHAHDIYLHTAVELGLPGLLGFLALVILVLRVWWLARREAGRWIGLADGAAGGLAAFLVFGLSDALPLGARPTVFFWAIAGLTILIARRRAPADQPADRYGRGLVVMAALCALVALPAAARHVAVAPADWSGVAGLLAQEAEGPDLVLVHADEDAAARLHARYAGRAEMAAAPADQTKMPSVTSGRHYVWLVESVGAVGAPGGDRQRRAMDRLAAVAGAWRFVGAHVLRYELRPRASGG